MRKVRCVVDVENIFQSFLYLYIHTQRFLDTSVMYTTVRHSDEGDHAFTGYMKPK